MDQQLDYSFVPDKDPEFHYFWANRADRNMVELIHQGWEIVTGAPELPPEVRQSLSVITGQSSEAPVSNEIRQRGDLILMRMRHDDFEKKVAAPDRARIQRQRASLDTLVQQANDQARAAMFRERQRNIRQRHVFTTSDDSKFDEQTQ